MSELSKQNEMPQYRYGSVRTPFQDPYQQTDRHLGKYLKKAEIWRKISFFSLALVVALSVFFCSLLNSPQTHVLSLMRFKTGFVQNTGWLSPKQVSS